MDKKDILKKFDRGNLQFSRVAREVRLIEDDSKTILIAKEEEAREILEQVRMKGVTKSLMRKMGRYCVNVRENVFQKLLAAGALEAMAADLKEDYFVLRDSEKYTDEMGLTLDVGFGEAVIF